MRTRTGSSGIRRRELPPARIRGPPARPPALAPSALLLAVAPACSNGGDTPSASPPKITVARLDPHPTSAISAVLHVETDAASIVSGTVDGPGGSFAIPAEGPATKHDIPVIGMRAESKYT